MILRNMRPMSRLIFAATFAGAAIALVSAPSFAAQNGNAGSKPPQQKRSRKTTDPPLAASGKLGQDLFLAIDHRDLAGAKALLKRGADPNSRNGLEFMPLYMAAASHQPEMMEALLASGAKANAASQYGTALTFAAMGGHAKGISILLAHGADPTFVRADGISVLMLASRMGSPDVVRDLLHRKTSVNGVDADGATPLIYAAREGHVGVGRVLVGAGATTDRTDSHGRTPLMYAAIGGHADFVRFLLEKGAKPNLLDGKGCTALLLSTKYGDYPDVVHALIAGGADPKAADASGRTAASFATARGHRGCADILGPNAASATMAGSDAKTAVKASLKLVESSMKQFNKRTGCVSCHQEGLGQMATAAAGERGFRLDPEVQGALIGRVKGGLDAMRPLHMQALKNPEVMKQVPLIEIEELGTGYCWLLAGLAAHNQPPSDSTAAMVMVLARQQAPGGNWRFSLPRVPMQSSFFTFTALAVRALKTYGPAADSAEVGDRIQRAKAWLLSAPAQTSEDRAARLLGLMWAGASEGEMAKAIAEIRGDQRPDGGWSQLPNLQSDAYATGQALYALHFAGGLSVNDAVYTNGVKYLLRTQDDDGSWFVSKRAIPANNYFDAGFPHGQSQYSSFNGTCWAMMALLQTLDVPERQASVVSR